MANGCRLIDADDILPKTFICDEVAEVRKFIEQAPTVDAVEVPCRCKECRYSVQDHPYDPMECMKWKTKWGVAYTTPDGYCHKGERKTNDKN